jgi:hypothetical protein
MIVVGALLAFTVLYSMFVVVPITSHPATPLGFIVVLGGFIFGWFAIIGISVNVHTHGSLRGQVIKEGFLGGMKVLKFWLTCMGLLLAVAIVLALTGH